MTEYRKTLFRLLIVCLFLPSLVSDLRSEENIIKFATLAPEGSTWMKVMQEWNRELTEKSGGRLKFKIYSGGVSGDEKDVVRKIRTGQLQAGGFTGVGLGEIAPEVRILDSPFLFQSVDETDHVYSAFEKEFESAFQKGGAVFLGWAEVGSVYIFTRRPVQSLSDMKGVKMWEWEGDPIAEATFRSLGLSPIPLSVTDVMTSLETGLVNGVYGSPLGVIALQWFTRAKYMYDFQLANACGAVLISKSFFDKLPSDLQTLLVSTGKKHMAQLTSLSRKENKEAIETLKKNGIQLSSPPSREVVDQYIAAGKNARRNLIGRLYSAELLTQVEKSVDEYRASRIKTKH